MTPDEALPMTPDEVRPLAQAIALHQPEEFLRLLAELQAKAWDEGHAMPTLRGANPYRKDAC